MSANEKLIENLEKQLERLVEQLKDLEDCKNEISEDEYDLLKSETIDQIKEFEMTLDRLQKGDVTLNSKFSILKGAIRNAISKAFNTKDMIQMFGDQDRNDLEQHLNTIEEEFRLKKIDQIQFEQQKIKLLQELQALGRPISANHLDFLQKNQNNVLLERLEEIEEN